MTTVLEDNTISMILTVPHVKELSYTVENLDESPPNNSDPPSIPIYHASIIHIEQHQDDKNISDLIVRVPNFHHVSIPSVTISINETDNQRNAHMKRRAPICPIANGRFHQNKATNESEHLKTNAKRLAISLRNLRRTIITNWKMKRSTNINQITIIPVMPDVEIIQEDFQIPTVEKKPNKPSSLTSKFLFIKQKHFKMNKKKPTLSTNSLDSQTDCEENRTNESSRANFNEIEQPNQSNENNNITSSSVNSATIISKPIPISTNLDHNDDELYIVHPNGDTYSECYEIIYELDPEFHREQISRSEVNDSSPWLSILPSNDYEQIDKTQSNSNLDQSEHSRVKFQSIEDLSQTEPDQTSTTISSSQDNNNNEILCLNTSEDYTVFLQLLKYASQIESIPADDCNEFNKQIKELFSK